MNLFNLKLKRYGLALVSVLAAFVARFVLEPILGAVAPLVLFSLAVTVSAWYGGLGPGLVATLASGLLGDYFFIPPLHTFRMSTHNLAEQVELYLFYATGIAISLMSQERFSSREKLRQLLIREREAREEAQTANRLKDEFLASASHELRTPLSAILGWAKILLKGRVDQVKSAQALETIERNATILSRLIDDLLDISRIISGRLQIDSGPVSLTPVIEAAADMIRPAADAKGIQLCLTLKPAAYQVMGDSTRLQQVVWNLLSNSVKFTPPDGRVDIKLDQVGPNARITVRDTGQGISPEFLPYVFDRFRQESNKSGGMGLGMAITKNLVELHGGTIEVCSAGEGQGATFRVYIPLLEHGSSATTEYSEIEMASPTELSALAHRPIVGRGSEGYQG
jgi:signal transduction histidine kinase